MALRRRDLLKLSALAAVVPSRARAQVPPGYQSTKYIAPRSAPSRITIANAEQGDPLVVTGKVMDWPRPLPGVSLYVFHADAYGHFTRDGSNDEMNARLHGALRTDAQGRFRYETIRPGQSGEAGGSIRYVVTQPGYRLRMEELRFADEREAFSAPLEVRGLKSGARKASTAFPDYVYAILPVEKDTQGVWRITHDIFLERQ